MQQYCDEKRTTGENKVGKVGFGSLGGGSAQSTDAGGDSNMEPGRRYCACPRLHGRRKRQERATTGKKWQRQRSEHPLGGKGQRRLGF